MVRLMTDHIARSNGTLYSLSKEGKGTRPLGLPRKKGRDECHDQIVFSDVRSIA